MRTELERNFQPNLIIDATLFLNEIELLKLRVDYLQKTGLVAKHVVVQGNRTLSGHIWHPILEEYLKEDGKQLIDLIDPIVVDLSDYVEPFEREYYLREQLLKYVKEKYHPCKIIFSDLDEIPSVDQVHKFHQENEREYSFRMETSYRKINLINSRMTPLDCGLFLLSNKEILPNGGRHQLNLPIIESKSIGSHFTYCFADREDFRIKVNSFAHFDLFEKAQVQSDTFLNFVDHFKVDHLGCITRKGFGLLQTKKNPSDLQLFAKEKLENLWDVTDNPSILTRIWAAARVSAIFNSARLPWIGSSEERAFKMLEYYFGTNQNISMIMRIEFVIVQLYELYCAIIEFNRRVKKNVIKKIMVN